MSRKCIYRCIEKEFAVFLAESSVFFSIKAGGSHHQAVIEVHSLAVLGLRDKEDVHNGLLPQAHKSEALQQLNIKYSCFLKK